MINMNDYLLNAKHERVVCVTMPILSECAR